MNLAITLEFQIITALEQLELESTHSTKIINKTSFITISREWLLDLLKLVISRLSLKDWLLIIKFQRHLPLVQINRKVLRDVLVTRQCTIWSSQRQSRTIILINQQPLKSWKLCNSNNSNKLYCQRVFLQLRNQLKLNLLFNLCLIWSPKKLMFWQVLEHSISRIT